MVWLLGFMFTAGGPDDLVSGLVPPPLNPAPRSFGWSLVTSDLRCSPSRITARICYVLSPAAANSLALLIRTVVTTAVRRSLVFFLGRFGQVALVASCHRYFRGAVVVWECGSLLCSRFPWHGFNSLAVSSLWLWLCCWRVGATFSCGFVGGALCRCFLRFPQWSTSSIFTVDSSPLWYSVVLVSWGFGCGRGGVVEALTSFC